MKILISANVSSDIVVRKKMWQRLIDAGHSLFAVSCVKDKDISFFNEMGIKLFPITFVPRSKNPLKDIALYRTYKKIFKSLCPDLILSYHIKPNIYGALASKKLNIPIIVNITGLGKVFDKKSLLESLVVSLYRRAFKRKAYTENARSNGAGTCFVFFQNTDDKALFLQRGIIKDEATCDVLPGSGVDISFFDPKLFSSPKNKNRVEFSFIGRLLKSKGISLFIEAAKIVLAIGKDCIFNIAGSIDEKDADFITLNELKEAIKGSIKDGSGTERIVYHGSISDVRLFLYEHTDCLVFPSFYREGIPRVLLEAASMGKILIASDSVGTREPCKDNVNGFLVKKNDVQDLVDKMLLFLTLDEEKKTKMGQASRLIAEKEFSDEIVIEKYLHKLKTFSQNEVTQSNS